MCIKEPRNCNPLAHYKTQMKYVNQLMWDPIKDHFVLIITHWMIIKCGTQRSLQADQNRYIEPGILSCYSKCWKWCVLLPSACSVAHGVTYVPSPYGVRRNHLVTTGTGIDFCYPFQHPIRRFSTIPHRAIWSASLRDKVALLLWNLMCFTWNITDTREPTIKPWDPEILRDLMMRCFFSDIDTPGPLRL